MATSRFQPTIKRSRIKVTGFSPQTMLQIGADVAAAIKARIAAGRDIQDQAAPALKPNYAKYKSRKGGQPIRDLKLTGRTMRALRPISAGGNQVTIGFSDPEAAKRVRLNQSRSRQFGMSPADKRVVVTSIARAESPVKIESVA